MLQYIKIILKKISQVYAIIFIVNKKNDDFMVKNKNHQIAEQFLTEQHISLLLPSILPYSRMIPFLLLRKFNNIFHKSHHG